ncbi:MAG: hypothetical protein CVU99_07860 [Firmicutes bacterium HGW-Firmicutes-4]|jgi:glycosyltransferase involved in cell wall biosynthesis|nr:MAG: hypothetical protein CVU99_07860 [Firmicutes bacterium HGW-Firmicutes-4]
MKVSVIMTTYNGRRFLREILDSLQNQTRLIEELLIFDDKSTDETVSYVQKYIFEHRIKNWYIIENEINLGWEKNFYQGLLKASGDIIYPCDQDDIWHLDKIEKMTQAFEENDDIWLMVSGYNAFSEQRSRMVKQHAVKTEYNKKVSRVMFDEHYYQILRPGCTMAFRKELLPLLAENWEPGTPHDAVLWIIASLLGKLYLYDDIFIEFRRHENNVSHVIKHGYSYKVNEVERTKKINQWYLMSEFHAPDKVDLIDNVNKWCDLRKMLLTERKLTAWFILFRYRSFYLTNKKYFGDLYYFSKQFKK